MRPSLLDLIDRMTVVDAPRTSSDDSVSWNAHREAERLDDPSLLPELTAFLAGKLPTDKRRAAYFIIGKLGENLGSAECAGVLIHHAAIEMDKYALESLLTCLAEVPKPQHLDLNPLFALLSDTRWIVRHAAIQSLRGTESGEAEDRILNLMQASSDPDDLIYCHSTLNRIGSLKAIPALQANVKSRKRDVKVSAQLAIEAIEGRAAGAK